MGQLGHNYCVIGGWTLTGDPDNAHWLNTAVSLDLSALRPEWKSIKQPFERRAFIGASYHGMAYVIGGFSTDSQPTKKVDIYNVVKQEWSTGPELPGGKMNGFWSGSVRDE